VGRPPSEFRVEVVADGMSVVVQPVGEIDIATVGSLQGALEVAATGAQRVIVDMSRVTFIDVAGITALLTGASAVRAHGGELVVRNLGTTARRVFEVLSVSRRLPVEVAKPTPKLETLPAPEPSIPDGPVRDGRHRDDGNLGTEASPAIAS
jgi:anti-sigma B factor antagonist